MSQDFDLRAKGEWTHDACGTTFALQDGHYQRCPTCECHVWIIDCNGNSRAFEEVEEEQRACNRFLWDLEHTFKAP